MNKISRLNDDPDLVFDGIVAGLKTTFSVVVDRFGSTVNRQGNSSGLGGETDLKLLKALRRNADVVLTSGATYRADSYKFPKNADLAILTRSQIDLEIPKGKALHLLRSGYPEAVSELRAMGYSKIQIEYGLTGLRAMVDSGESFTLFLSSRFESGIRTFLSELRLESEIFGMNDLFFAVLAWQGDIGCRAE